MPDLLFTVVAGGALATAFIPVFATFLAEGDRQGAWRLTSAITNLVTLAVAGLALLAALVAPWLVRVLIAPGFDMAQQAETVDLMRLVLGTASASEVAQLGQCPGGHRTPVLHPPRIELSLQEEHGSEEESEHEELLHRFPPISDLAARR